MSQPSSIPVQSKTIELPEDRPTQLFVLAIASNMMMAHHFTPERYDNEVLQQEVSGLTNTSRDVHTSHIRRLASEKRERGLIEDIGGESVVKRVPSWLYIAVPVFAVLAVLAYGQYNVQFGNEIAAGWNANSGYIVVGIILIFAFVLLLRFRRRRPKA